MHTISQPTDGVTVSAALSALLDLTAQRVDDGVRSPATLGMQRQHRRWWERVLGPDLPITSITGGMLEEIAAGRPPGPSTLAKLCGTLRAALALQHRRGQLGALPPFPRLLIPWRPRTALLESYAQAVALFNSLPRHRAAWMWLCLWTCMHAADVDAAQWSDVDLQRTTILIRNTKNRMVPVRVKIPAPLLWLLRSLWKRDRPRPTDHIVRPWPSRCRTLRLHCDRLGLPRVNAIDLRRTGLSWIVARTGITPAACRWAGHRSPQMMARAYAHALPAQLTEVTAELNAFARARRPPRRSPTRRSPAARAARAGGATSRR